MKVCVIGTGYVGLVSGTCFAEIGHNVTCIDINEEKIKTLQKGKSPIYEPGLSDLLERNIKRGSIHFSTNYNPVKEARVIFLAVDTPPMDNGEADLSRIQKATESVAKNITSEALVVIKSTVPVGTHKFVKEILEANTDKKSYVVNNPEFLKEGSAIDDFMKPDRVVIGVDNNVAADVMEELYAPLVRQGNPIYTMSNLSAEMTKYAANCFLATKISFINEIANLCDATGADIDEVRKGITSDSRIGKHFLYPGTGYGGSCFPKDVQALIATGEKYGAKLEIVDAAHKVNDAQKIRLFEKIMKHYGNINGKIFAFWGVAFKPNTDDIREAPALFMADALISAGAKIHYYDPIAADNFEKEMKKYGDKTKKIDQKYEAVKGVDGLILLTEWMEFRHPDFLELKDCMNQPVVFDGRNIYQTKVLLDFGFHYYAIGKCIAK